jgi:hypothetical protein
MTFKFKQRSTVKGIAREMLRCFEDRERWTVGAYARDRSFASVRPASPEAVCWCGAGATFIIAPDRKLQLRFYDAFRMACGQSIAHVNDGQDGYNRLRKVLTRLAS